MRNVTFVEARKIVGTYMEKTASGCIRPTCNNQDNKYRTLVEKLANHWLPPGSKFQEHLKTLHSVEFY